MSKWPNGFVDDLNKMVFTSCLKSVGWMCMAGIAIWKAVDNAYHSGQGRGALIITDQSTPIYGPNDPNEET